MTSVTGRIKEIKQPNGGYINPKILKITSFNDELILNEENINPGIVGTAVDYLSRFLLGTKRSEAFKVSLLGASNINKNTLALSLLNNISGLDDNSITNACKLAGFDVCFRAGLAYYKTVEDINPDSSTIENIRIMVNRSLIFFENYGPIIKDGFTFEGGYSSIINAGDGDFLTTNGLWDFKVSKSKPTTAHTLQLLIYYIMGVHSIHNEFNSIKYLGIFNPRLNIMYTLNVSDIGLEKISTVEKDVICY